MRGHFRHLLWLCSVWWQVPTTWTECSQKEALRSDDCKIL
jgi:hypothetical protein